MNTMNWFNKGNGFSEINKLSRSRTPFLFITSFNGEKIFAQSLDNLDNDIFYKLEDWRNYAVEQQTQDFTFSKWPIGFSTYKHTMSPSK